LKTPLPRCASDRPEAGVHLILAIFMITMRMLQIHVRFYKAKIAIIFKNRYFILIDASASGDMAVQAL
jgi:hypothetical protein